MTYTEYLQTLTNAQLRTILARMDITRGLSGMRKAELIETVEGAVAHDFTEALAEDEARKPVQGKFIGFDARVAAYHATNGGKVLTRRQARRASKKFKTQLKRTGDIALALEGVR